MPRKPSSRSSAASSSSAAALSNSSSATPTFTSFAAATAQILASQQTPQQKQKQKEAGTTAAAATTSTTEWDEQANTYMKKLNKRDTTTKLKALIQLKKFLSQYSNSNSNSNNNDNDNNNKVPSESGQIFLSSWAVMFSTLVHNMDANIRLESIHIMQWIMLNLGKKCQQLGLLQKLFPLWISCTGDESHIVCETTNQSIDAVFQSVERKYKVVVKYHQSFISYCTQLVTKLNNHNSKSNKSENHEQHQDSIKKDCLKIIAVLKWMLTITKDVQLISPVLHYHRQQQINNTNDNSNTNDHDLFQTIVKMSNRFIKSKLPLQLLIDLSIHIIHVISSSTSTSTSTDQHKQTLNQISNFAFQLAKIHHPMSWDLFIILLSETPHTIIPHQLDKLTSALLKTITNKNDVNTSSALLPILASIHKFSTLDHMLSIAKQLLVPLQHKFFPSSSASSSENPKTEKEDHDQKNQSVSSSMSLVIQIYPSFVETVTFILNSIKKSDTSQHNDIDELLREWSQLFALPICNDFLCGNLPSVTTYNNKIRNETMVKRRTDNNNNNNNTNRDNKNLLVSIASLFRLLLSNDNVMNININDMMDNFIRTLSKRNKNQVLQRFIQLLGAIDNTTWEAKLGKVIIQRFAFNLSLKNENQQEGQHESIIDKNEFISNGLSILAVILSKPSAFMIPQHSGDTQHVNALVNELMATFNLSVLPSIPSPSNEVVSDEDDFNNTFQQVGLIYSWILWLSSLCDSNEQVCKNIFNDINQHHHHHIEQSQSFQIILHLIQAHEERYKQVKNLPENSIVDHHSYPSLPIDLLESTVHDIIEIFNNTGNITDTSIDLITTNIELIPLSSECIDSVIKMILMNFKQSSNSVSIDRLIVTLLRSDYIGKSQHKSNFMTVAFQRATLSTYAMSEFSARISSLSTSECSTLLIDLCKLYISPDTNMDQSSITSNGKALALLISQLGERDIPSSASVCQYICSKLSSVALIQSVLTNMASPLYVFGEDVVVMKDIMFAIMQHQNDGLNHVLLSSVPDYIANVSANSNNSLPKLCAFLTKAVLNSVHINSIEIIKTICTYLTKHIFTTADEKQPQQNVNSLKMQLNSVLLSIANEIEQTLPATHSGITITPEEKEEKKQKFRNVSLIIFECIKTSMGEMLTYLEQMIGNLVQIIRRDIISENSLISMDIIFATLSSMQSFLDPGKNQKWLWFEQNISIIVQSLRKCLEIPRGLSKSNINQLEAYGAAMLYHAIKAFHAIHDNDKRFWRLRIHDILKQYVQSQSQQSKGKKNKETVEEIDLENCKRIAWICELANLLLDSNSENEIEDEIYYFGSWTTVYILPKLHQQWQVQQSHNMKKLFDMVKCKGNSKLILHATQKGVLLSKNGTIPIKYEDVYKLIPLLKSSKQDDLRKSLFVLIAHTIGIDLPERINENFPKNGFKTEEDEEQFSADILPQELLNELQWDEKCDEIPSYEIGFFLTWRLLLDLMHGGEEEDHTTDSVHDADADQMEEISVRRIATTYLRRINPSLFDQFLAKCVDVVVDGSEIERVAAANAAQQALRLEENVPAQGIQLAKQQEQEEQEEQEKEQQQNGPSPAENKEEEEDDDYDYDDYELGLDGAATFISDENRKRMEKLVGQAAGVAFARSLQRVPALSREVLNGGRCIDRGALYRVEEFVRKRISSILIAAEVQKVRNWGSFGGGNKTDGNALDDVEDGYVEAKGSVAGREVLASYRFSDVTLEMGVRLPESFPLKTAVVEAKSRVGMSESRWRKTVLGMTTLLQDKDGYVAEAVQVWKTNLDQTFKGKEECPICYSVLHLSTASLPKKQCRTCKKKFHSECLCKWFTKSNSSACPLCRSAF